jgi:hypothetical protein
VQKLADSGYIHLKQVDRSLIVEWKEYEPEVPPVTPAIVPATPADVPETSEPAAGTAKPPLQAPEAMRALLEWLQNSAAKFHWPLYLRNLKQFLHSSQPAFDERQYGITSIYDLVRLAQKESIFRVERNRQGVLRIFAGEQFPQPLIERPPEGGAFDVEQPPVPSPLMETEAELKLEPAISPEPLVEVLPSTEMAVLQEGEEVPGKIKRRRKTSEEAGSAKKVRGGIRKSRSAKKNVPGG